MLLFLLLFNSFLVFGLKYQYDYDYEFTCRVASICHAIVSLIGSVLFITNILSYSLFQYIISYNVVYILISNYAKK